MSDIKPFAAQVFHTRQVVAGVRAAARAIRDAKKSIGIAGVTAATRQSLLVDVAKVLEIFEKWDETLTARLEDRPECHSDPPPRGCDWQRSLKPKEKEEP